MIHQVSGIGKIKAFTELAGGTPTGQIPPATTSNSPITPVSTKPEQAINAPPRPPLVEVNFKACVFHPFDTNIHGIIDHDGMKECSGISLT